MSTVIISQYNQYLYGEYIKSRCIPGTNVLLPVSFRTLVFKKLVYSE